MQLNGVVSKKKSQSILKSNPPINQLVWLVNEQPLAKVVLLAESPTNNRKPSTLQASDISNNSDSHSFVSAPESSPRSSGSYSSSAGPIKGAGEEEKGNNDAGENATEENSNIAISVNKEKETQFFPANDTREQMIVSLNTKQHFYYGLRQLENKYIAKGNDLTIMNLTKLDSKDEYKCKAINILGESKSSNKLKLSINCKCNS